LTLTDFLITVQLIQMATSGVSRSTAGPP